MPDPKAFFTTAPGGHTHNWVKEMLDADAKPPAIEWPKEVRGVWVDDTVGWDEMKTHGLDAIEWGRHAMLSSKPSFFAEMFMTQLVDPASEMIITGRHAGKTYSIGVDLGRNEGTAVLMARDAAGYEVLDVRQLKDDLRVLPEKRLPTPVTFDNRKARRAARSRRR